MVVHRGWLYPDNSCVYPDYISSLLLVRCNHCLSYPTWLYHSWFCSHCCCFWPYTVSEIPMALAGEIPMACEWQSILTNLLALQHMHFWVNQQSTARNFPWYPHEKIPTQSLFNLQFPELNRNVFTLFVSKYPIPPFRPVAEVQSQIQPATQPLAAPAGRSSAIAAGPGICCVTDEALF